MATNRLVDDAGVLVPGARKHLYGKGLTHEDIAGLPPSEAAAMVRKDAVWPAPDYGALVDAGLPPRLAALAKIVRDRLPKEPVMMRSRQRDRAGDDIRKDYITMVSIIRAAVEGLETEAEAERLHDIVLRLSGRPDWRDDRLHDLLDTVLQPNRRIHSFQVSGADISKARDMVAQGFPRPVAVPPWLRGIVFRSRPDGTMVALKGKAIVARDFDTEDAGAAILRSMWETARTEAASGPQDPPSVRPNAGTTERAGLPERRTGDVDPDAFIAAFGFRAVQFGESMSNVERQRVLNDAYDALMDLADVLDVPPASISLGGRLAAAFGARGAGGHPAHYEPGRRIFNIGRANGAGSLAHEWGHALDDVVGEIATRGRGKGRTLYASESTASLPGLSLDQADRWREAMLSMLSRPLGRDEAMKRAQERIDAINERLVSGERSLEAARSAKHPNRGHIKRLVEWIEAQRQTAIALRETIAKISDLQPDERAGSAPSNFYTDAVALCGKSGEYWKRRCELFARAFESVVFDALKDAGGHSGFLVHGVEPERYADKQQYKGNPYPPADERARIREALLPLARELVLSVSPAPEPVGPTP